MKIVTIIQARTGSHRFPGKVLQKLGNQTILEVITERVRFARLSGEVVVATTVDQSDDVIFDLCHQKNIPCFRGSVNDLLDRHYQTALALEADAIVKIPSDCPLIDPLIIDRVLRYYINNYAAYDFVSNLHPPTWPDGNDVEIMPVSALEEAWKLASENHEREHTTPFIWDNPDNYRIGNVVMPGNKDYSKTLRWTLDYIEDYNFIKTVYEYLAPRNPFFTCDDIINLLEMKPQLKMINQQYLGVNWYRNHLTDLKTITKNDTMVLREEV